MTANAGAACRLDNALKFQAPESSTITYRWIRVAVSTEVAAKETMKTAITASAILRGIP
jgi:hypothetical protein